MNGRNEVFLLAHCSGSHMAAWDKGGGGAEPGRLNKHNNIKLKTFSQKPSVHSENFNRFTFFIGRPPLLCPSLQVSLSSRHAYAIITAVPENNLTWLCVSMATMPTSVTVSQFLSTYIITACRLQKQDCRNEPAVWASAVSTTQWITQFYIFCADW